MDRITMDILKQAFLDRHSGWCVSLFMPTHRSGRDTEQDPIRFKNQVRLLEGGIPGNPESLKPEELHGQAWALVEPVFKEAREESTARYRQLAGTGGTTRDVKEAVLAAHHGRIDVLFVAVGVQVWGRFDPENDKVYVHEPPEPGDEDLLDLTAIQTLINGGMVYAVLPEEVPDHALLAAIMRY